MDAPEGMKKAIAQLRKDTDDMIKRLRDEIKASLTARQKRMAEQRRTE
ncbi:unnamed protein product [marine sediment metagenome]|uniref:Uncharacterized protein n=1 Tax=marine sediment metagenome TaxID=412755 RepID=X1RL58_9ZZZZ